MDVVSSMQKRAFLMLMGVAFFEWPFASVERFLGYYTKNVLLSSASISDALAFGFAMLALGFGLLSRPRLSGSTFMVVLGATVLLLQLIVEYAAGGPLVSGAWNTPTAEIARTVTILAIYIAYALIDVRRVTSGQAHRFLYLMVLFGYFGFAIAVLQSVNLLPNFFFQWYDGGETARPTGGFSHPHYFGAVCVLSAVAALVLARRGRMRQTIADFTFVAMGAAVLVSTSRVGVIFYLAVAAIYATMRFGRKGNWALLTILFGVYAAFLAAALYWVATGHPVPIENYIDVFSQPFAEGNDVFRGRSVKWTIELDYIFHDASTTLFGYGYQPFVSHNLVLRQMQVSGAFGTMVYFALILALGYRGWKAALPGYRIYLFMVWVPILIASLTLPVLVAVTLNAALTVFAVAVGRTSLASTPQPDADTSAPPKPAHIPLGLAWRGTL